MLSINAAPSYEIHAGAGSSGAIGGAGGAIDHITEKTSTSKVVAIAGAGGNGATGPGGAGGSISAFDAGSDSSRYFLTAGKGGNGIPGGNGGSVIGNNFANRSPIGGLLVTGNFDGDTNNVDELVIINQGTGEMIVEKNVLGDGTSFAPITQYTPAAPGSDPVTVISTLGNTPVSAYATDVNNDGKLDLVVAYKNSNSIGIFLGQGDGTFWDPTLNGGDGGYDTINVPLQFTPSKITPSGGRIVVAENLVDGTSALHLLTKTLDTQGVLTYAVRERLQRADQADHRPRDRERRERDRGDLRWRTAPRHRLRLRQRQAVRCLDHAHPDGARRDCRSRGRRGGRPHRCAQHDGQRVLYVRFQRRGGDQHPDAGQHHQRPGGQAARREFHQRRRREHR